MVQDYTFSIPLDQFESDTLYIAIHTVLVVIVNYKTIISDEATMIIKGNGDSDSYPQNAVRAWEPFGDHDPSYWDNHVDYNFGNSGADWIWESYRVMHPVKGDIVTFERLFKIGSHHRCPSHRCFCGWPRRLLAVLHITADNGYEVYLNGKFVGSAQLGDGYATSDLTEEYVNTNGWQTVEHYKVSKLLKSGINNLTIIAANEYMGPNDGQADGTIDTNPAGLIFELEIFRLKNAESAWAKGEHLPCHCHSRIMYIVYHIQR